MKKKQKRIIKRNETINHKIVIQVESKPQSLIPIKESDLLPEKDGGKYMIPKTWLSEKQVVRMVQRTPQQHVYTRPAKGGGTWNYVTGNYIEKVLNFTFGWNWDFEIVNHGKEGEQVWVLGKLTVKDDKGHMITKTQFGRADIKFRKGSKDMLDFGNDLKSAATDSMKKSASLLGIASDIYGKLEFKQETGADIANTANGVENAPTATTAHKKALPAPSSPQKGQVIGPDGTPVWTCKGCDGIVSDQVAKYSVNIFGKILCGDCQKNKK